MTPYALVYLQASAVRLGPEDVTFMDHILRTRFDIEYTEYLRGMAKFYRQYTLLPVFPLALLGTWAIAKYGDQRERLLGKHIWLWIAGVYVVILLFVLDQEISQYFAALTNMRSVGVMGDERTYDYAVALRAVKTIDFMTAEAAEIPFEVLQKVMSRIINEVKGVNRVFYDLTSKPPGTIEFE